MLKRSAFLSRGPPDDRGVTHLDFRDDAIAQREPERLAYHAFDLI